MSVSSYKVQVTSLLILGLLLEVACLEMVRIGDLRTTLFDLQDLLPASYFPSLFPRPPSLLLFWLPFAAAFLSTLSVFTRVTGMKAVHRIGVCSGLFWVLR